MRDGAGGSDLERAFVTLWRQLGGPEPYECEHRYHPTRRWRFDFAWPDVLVAVEVEGGVWVKGRHVRGVGFEQDCDKYNAAAWAGWAVFRLTGRMLEDDPAGHLEPIMDLIRRRRG